MKLDNCDDSILEGISYACEAKVYCEDCKYNDYLSCKSGKAKGRNEFTGDVFHGSVWKEDLNPDGKCKYYKQKTNFISLLIKKLWK